MQTTVIGIAGGSGSGKSTLAQRVVEFAPADTVMLAFDSYYRDQRYVSKQDRQRVNYDHPNSLDVERFTQDLAALKAGSGIAAPVYDFATHTRSDEIHLVEAAPIVVVDGILLLVFEEICDLVDIKVFVDVPDEIRTARRVARDVAERGRTARYALEQIERTVRPMYGEFVGPSMDRADLVVDGTADVDTSAHAVLGVIGATVG